MLPDELSIHKHIDPAPCGSLSACWPCRCRLSSLHLPSPAPWRVPPPRPQISQLAMQLRDLPSMPTTGRCGTLGSHAPYHAPAPHSNGAWSPQNGCSAPPGAPGARACRRRTRSAYQRSWVRIGYPLSGRAERCTLQYRPRVRASFLGHVLVAGLWRHACLVLGEQHVNDMPTPAAGCADRRQAGPAVAAGPLR